MKNFSQFMLESKRISKDIYFNLTADQLREEYIAGNIFKEGISACH